MNNKFTHITIFFVTGIILLLLTALSASAQKPVERFEVDQCDTLEFQVQEFPGDRYTWDLYSDADGNFAIDQGNMPSAVYFENGMYEGTTVRVIDLAPGVYYLRVMVWDEVECTNNLLVFEMEVIESIPEITLVGDSACIGEATSVRIIFTGVGPYTISYTYGDELTGNVVNMNGEVVDGPEVTIPITQPLPVGEATFWVISVEDDCKAYEYPVDERPSTGVLIYPKPAQERIYLKED